MPKNIGSLKNSELFNARGHGTELVLPTIGTAAASILIFDGE
jgi:hypothetical protein